MTKKLKCKFLIGDPVIIKAEAVPLTSQGKRRVNRQALAMPLEARITGMKMLRCGTVIDDCEYSRYLKVTESKICYAFRIGMLNKERYAFEEDTKHVTIYDPQQFPTLVQDQPKLTVEDRRLMRQAALKQPRDERGKFIKEQKGSNQ